MNYEGMYENIKYHSVFPFEQKFTCKRCGHCCRSKDVELSESDIRKIASNTTHKIKEFVNDSNKTKTMKHKDGACVFLDDNKKCSVYRFRPATCRTYPYKVFFEDIDQASIDIMHSCPSVVENDSEENEIKFRDLIQKTFKEIQKEPELLTFIKRLKDNVTHSMDKRIATQKVFDYIFEDSSDPLEVYQKIVSLQSQLKDMGKIKFSSVDKIILKSKQNKQTIERNDFNNASFMILKENVPISGFDLNLNFSYEIDANETEIVFRTPAKELSLKVENYEIDNDEALKEYLHTIWNKKILEYEIYTYVMEQLRYGNDVSSLGFQLRVTAKIIVLLNALLLCQCAINKKKSLSINEIHNSIISLDPYLHKLCVATRNEYRNHD